MEGPIKKLEFYSRAQWGLRPTPERETGKKPATEKRRGRKRCIKAKKGVDGEKTKHGAWGESEESGSQASEGLSLPRADMASLASLNGHSAPPPSMHWGLSPHGKLGQLETAS